MTSTEESGLNERELRDVFGSFPSGVVAIAATVDAKPFGMAASTFTPVSLEPALVSVCIANTSSTWRRLRGVQMFGVSVLGEHHDLACRQLAGPEGQRFSDLEWIATDDRAVLLHGAAAWFECGLEAEVPAGDHLIALFRIHKVQHDRGVLPLVFHRSEFRRLHIGELAHAID